MREMDEGYIRPEHFLFSTVTSVLMGLLMIAPRPSETQGRYTMIGYSVIPREIVGYSTDEFPNALEMMEASMDLGEEARISICTEALPTDEDLDTIYLGMIAQGCHISQPTAGLVKGVPTTEFILQKGSPQWQVIVPVLVPLFIIGLITFSITRIEAISRALVPLMLITIGGLIILAVVLQKPAMRYVEAGGRIPRLPATKKALAAR